MLPIKLAKDKRITCNRVAALVCLSSDKDKLLMRFYMYLYLPKYAINKKGTVDCIEHLPDDKDKDITHTVEYLVYHALIHEMMHYVLFITAGERACDQFDNVAHYVLDEVMKDVVC